MMLPLAACIGSGLLAGKLLPSWIGQHSLVRRTQTVLLVAVVTALGVRMGTQQATPRWGLTLARSLVLAIGSIAGSVLFTLPFAGVVAPDPVRAALPGEVSSPLWLLALAIGSLVTGAVVGAAQRRRFDPQQLERVALCALGAMLFCIGLDGGSSESVGSSIASLSPWVLLVPPMIALGSVAGGCAAGLLLRLRARSGAAVGAGCGWYTLTTLILGEMDGPELAAYGLLANMFREAISLLTIPLIAHWHRGVIMLAPAGCTAVDTGFAMIGRLGGDRMGLMAFLTGIMCSLMVPVLVRVSFKRLP